MVSRSMRTLVAALYSRVRYGRSADPSRTSSDSEGVWGVREGESRSRMTMTLTATREPRMEDPQQFERERQAILEAQQQLDAAQRSQELFRQQVDTLIRTLQVDEWGAFQEYQREQQQNALEYARDQQRQMER
jgi:hypothetical protein